MRAFPELQFSEHLIQSLDPFVPHERIAVQVTSPSLLPAGDQSIALPQSSQSQSPARRIMEMPLSRG